MKVVIDTSTKTAVSKSTDAVSAHKLCEKLNYTQRVIGKPERFRVISVEDYYKTTRKSLLTN